jgi:hypothetical protein
MVRESILDRLVHRESRQKSQGTPTDACFLVEFVEGIGF